MKITTHLLLLIILVASCNKEYTQESCEELSLKKYRGFPNASHEFDKNCKGKFQIKYTQKACNAAFLGLVTHGSKEKLEAEFGKRILECFTDMQKNKHLQSN